MELISDTMMVETGKKAPSFPEVYPKADDLDLGDTRLFTDGHPFQSYAALREHAPVSWYNVPTKMADGFWAITRYEDIKAVELAPDVYSSQRGTMSMAQLQQKSSILPEKLSPAIINAFINLDAPQHMEMRIQQKDFFIPRFVETLKERISVKIDSLLDDLEAAGPETDFVKVFSTQLPLFTVCEMLGIDEDQRQKIVSWMGYLERTKNILLAPFSTLLTEPLLIPRFQRGVREMFEFGEEIMNDRKANPRNDLLTTIAQSQLNGEDLPQEYLDGAWLLIIFAGNDTTRNTLSGTLRLLTEFPDQRQLLLDDPSLIPNMTHEAIRMISPVMHMRRTATQEVELNGQKIARDEKVVMWYGAANRDPDIFTEPDRFDVTRANAEKHLGFGHGPHKCLGSRIALMQLRLSYEKILERFPNIAWTGKQKLGKNNFVHSINSLTVSLNGK